MKTIGAMSLPIRVLATGYLIVLGCGFGVSHLYLHMKLLPPDSPRQMPTLEDIAHHFHGDPTATRLKKMVQGSMKKYFSEDEDPAKLTPVEQADLDKVLSWNDRGGPEAEFWNPETKEPGPIYTIFFKRSCLDCHSKDGEKSEAPLTTYAEVQRYLEPDKGIDLGRLVMLGHVHLLGMGMMFLGVGVFVAITSWSTLIRSLLIGAGFASVLFDIGGWFAVKFGGATFAPLVMLGGTLMAGTFGLSTLAVLYDCWVCKVPEQSAA